MKFILIIISFILSPSLFADDYNHCMFIDGSYGMTTSSVHHLRVKVNDDVKLKSKFTYWICNAEDHDATYEVYFSVSDQLGHYISKIDRVTVKKRGYIKGEKSLSMNVIYDQKGKFVIAATSHINKLHGTKSYDVSSIRVE